MFDKCITALFFGVYTLFLLRFLLLLGDGSDVFIYTSYRPAIDLIYSITSTLGIPVAWITQTLISIFPSVKSDVFPSMGIAVFGKLASNIITLINLKAAIIPANIITVANQVAKFTGVLDWLAVFNLVFYTLMQQVAKKALGWANNLLWSVITESCYRKDKEIKYQTALSERSVAISKQQLMLEKEAVEKEKLKQSVLTDELTRVFNKRFFLEKVKEEFKIAKNQKTALGIIMVDIDHFKKLNDTYGHLMGDKVLFKVAQAAKLATPGKAYCCRFGGEEFSIILPGKSFEEVQAVAKAIHQQLPLLAFEEDRNIKVTCSQGICYTDFSKPKAQSFSSPDNIIQLADEELYKAKLGGRNRVCAIKVES
jgi:diguanylate cyclase (GGDEF)-like protein